MKIAISAAIEVNPCINNDFNTFYYFLLTFPRTLFLGREANIKMKQILINESLVYIAPCIIFFDFLDEILTITNF